MKRPHPPYAMERFNCGDGKAFAEKFPEFTLVNEDNFSRMKRPHPPYAMERFKCGDGKAFAEKFPEFTLVNEDNFSRMKRPHPHILRVPKLRIQVQNLTAPHHF
jgi:hypothetical protein